LFATFFGFLNLGLDALEFAFPLLATGIGCGLGCRCRRNGFVAFLLFNAPLRLRFDSFARSLAFRGFGVHGLFCGRRDWLLEALIEEFPGTLLGFRRQGRGGGGIRGRGCLSKNLGRKARCKAKNSESSVKLHAFPYFMSRRLSTG